MEEGIVVEYLSWNKKVRGFLSRFLVIAIILLIPLIFFINTSLETITSLIFLAIIKWAIILFILGAAGLLIYAVMAEIFGRKIIGELKFSDSIIAFSSVTKNFNIDVGTLENIHLAEKNFDDFLILTKTSKKKIYFRLLYDVQFENLFKQLEIIKDKVKIEATPNETIDLEKVEDNV